MRSILTLALAALVAAPLVADDPEPPDPKANTKGVQSGPLLVRLVAKKTAYVLDRQGMTAEKYREAIRDGKVSPPEVDLVLEISNTSKENVTVRVAGAVPALAFKITGSPGAGVQTTANARLGKGPRVKNVVLKPGDKHEIAIKALDSTAVSRPRESWYWTEPGKYTISAELTTNATDANGKSLALRPPPAKGKAGAGGKAKPPLASRSVLVSQPVNVNVRLK